MFAKVEHPGCIINIEVICIDIAKTNFLPTGRRLAQASGGWISFEKAKKKNVIRTHEYLYITTCGPRDAAVVLNSGSRVPRT